MGIKSKSAAVAAALSMIATPAFAQDAPTDQQKAPGQICKSFEKKKTNGGKGKSPFAACVVGVKSARTDLEKVAEGEKTKKSNPTTLCKGMAKKKGEMDEKSPFAACVSGAAKAQREAKKLEREAKKAEKAEQPEQS